MYNKIGKTINYGTLPLLQPRLWLVLHHLLYRCIVLLEDNLLYVRPVLLAALGTGVHQYCAPVNALPCTVHLQMHQQLWHYLMSQENAILKILEALCMVLTLSFIHCSFHG